MSMDIDGYTVSFLDLGFDAALKQGLRPSELAQKYVEYALSANGGSKAKAARALGVSRESVFKRLQSRRKRAS